MIQALPESPAAMLELRLDRGAELLFDMEQRGDMGADYDRFLSHFLDLLQDYEEQAQF
jgi:hypothetical protein